MEKTPGFYSQPNSTTSIATTVSDELIPTQKTRSNQPNIEAGTSTGTTTDTLQIPNLESKKSVHFFTTATSTTTLPNSDSIKRLRPELNTLLSVLIKQNRSEIKSRHHIEILQESVNTRNPPRGLRPRINPRIPDNKQIDFLIEWDQVTTEAAISYTKLLLKHWEQVLKNSTENIEKIEERITSQGASLEEWKKIRETIEKIRQQTQEDLDKKIDRKPFNPQNKPMILQEPQNTEVFYQQTPLPQRTRREDFRRGSQS